MVKGFFSLIENISIVPKFVLKLYLELSDRWNLWVFVPERPTGPDSVSRVDVLICARVTYLYFFLLRFSYFRYLLRYKRFTGFLINRTYSAVTL